MKPLVLKLVFAVCLFSSYNFLGQCPDDPGEGFLGTYAPSEDNGKTVCICIENGFEVTLGATLNAFIDGCNGSGGDINP